MLRAVKFGASTCSMCNTMSKVLENIDYLKVEEIDVNESKNDELVEMSNVRKLPTTIFYRGSEKLAVKVGYVSEKEIHKIYNKEL